MQRLFASTIIAFILAFVPAGLSAQFRWGPTVGANLTDLTFKQDLVEVDRVAGYSAGVQGEFMFPGIGFGIDLGLIYNQKGAKVNLGEKRVWSSLGYGDERAYLHYVQIPLHLRFKWTRMNGLEDIIAPFVFGGPDFTILAAHGGCEAFDYAGGELGLSVGGGIELLKRYQISFSYNWGMTYALKTKLLDNFSARNREWNIRLTYLF